MIFKKIEFFNIEQIKYDFFLNVKGSK